jgi:diacylglycerol kinase
MTSTKRFLKSFFNASQGFKTVWQGEINFRLHVLCGGLVIIFAWILNCAFWEKIILVLLVGLVLTVELINTAFEVMADILKPRIHPSVGQIKDILAAAVLLMSILAGLIGLAIFIPRLMILVN